METSKNAFYNPLFLSIIFAGVVFFNLPLLAQAQTENSTGNSTRIITILPGYTEDTNNDTIVQTPSDNITNPGNDTGTAAPTLTEDGPPPSNTAAPDN